MHSSRRLGALATLGLQRGPLQVTSAGCVSSWLPSRTKLSKHQGQPARSTPISDCSQCPAQQCVLRSLVLSHRHSSRLTVIPKSSCCGAAASSDNNAHSHSHTHDHAHSHSHGHSHGHHHHHHHGHAGHSHGHHHGHGHTHGHGHSHGHGHHHHQHYYTASGEPDLSTKILDKLGLLTLSEVLEHNAMYTVASAASFFGALACNMLTSAALVSGSLWTTYLPAALIGVTFVLSGIPQLVETVQAFAHRQVDTHVLMSLAVVGTAYMGMAQEGALLLLLFRAAHLLEDKLTQRAAGSLERLFASIPSRATLVQLDSSGAPNTATAEEVEAATVQLGQHVMVRPGEQVPLDGTIVWGVANISLQHITGESQPVKMVQGGQVPAGSLSTDGLLVVEVQASAMDSTPARIARMAADAQASKPQVTRWLDGVGAAWSKAVIAATLAALVGLAASGVPLLGPGGALYRALGVLTAGSPCALVLVPLAYVCALASITRRGVLVKAAGALDALAGCGTVALDKTGTITTGSLTLTGGYLVQLDAGSGQHVATIPITTLPSSSSSSSTSSSTSSSGSGSDSTGFEQRALQYAIALSQLSNHPVSRATSELELPGALPVRVASFEQVPGEGVQGLCQLGDGPLEFARFGSLSFITQGLSEAGISLDPQALGSAASSATRAAAYVTISPAPGSAAAAAAAAPKPAAASSSAAEQQGMAISYDRDGFPTYHFAAAGSTAGSSSTLQPPASAAAQPPAAAAATGPLQVAVLCYEDIIQQGVAQAVQQLRSGTWADGSAQPKQVVMLTGDHPEVAAAVAGAVGISDYRASLRPEHKLQYVQQHSQLASDLAAAAAAGGAAERISSRKMLSALFLGGGKGSKQQGLVMMGDGINDAPALAAASVGVAVAATPNDLVAAAADVIVLNGQGVANLPPLFSLAQRTQAVVRQNLALALLSVVFATVPTVAGIFPLWLAVTLHEGSTLLVAINSLRLLLDEQQGSSGAGGLAREAMASLAPGSAAAAAAGVATGGPGAAVAPGAGGEAHQHQHQHPHSHEEQQHGHDHEHSSHGPHHHHHHHEDGSECCGGHQQQGGSNSGSVATSVPVSSLSK